MVVIEQGETAERAFKAVDRTIGNMTTIRVFLTVNLILIKI
jgi:hypothetical protein